MVPFALLRVTVGWCYCRNVAVLLNNWGEMISSTMVPGASSSLWIPVNLQEVEVTGLEVSGQAGYRFSPALHVPSPHDAVAPQSL